MVRLPSPQRSGQVLDRHVGERPAGHGDSFRVLTVHPISTSCRRRLLRRVSAVALAAAPSILRVPPRRTEARPRPRTASARTWAPTWRPRRLRMLPRGGRIHYGRSSGPSNRSTTVGHLRAGGHRSSRGRVDPLEDVRHPEPLVPDETVIRVVLPPAVGTRAPESSIGSFAARSALSKPSATIDCRNRSRSDTEDASAPNEGMAGEITPLTPRLASSMIIGQKRRRPGSVKCPTCASDAVSVGPFWICPRCGQIPAPVPPPASLGIDLDRIPSFVALPLAAWPWASDPRLRGTLSCCRCR